MPTNECIPVFEPADRITGRCTAAVRGKRFVVNSAPASGSLILGTNNISITEAGAGARAIGVSGYDGVLNEEIPVITDHSFVPVTSGAAVAAGAEVQSDAQGRAITLAAGKALGIALDTVGAADVDLPVKLYS